MNFTNIDIFNNDINTKWTSPNLSLDDLTMSDDVVHEYAWRAGGEGAHATRVQWRRAVNVGGGDGAHATWIQVATGRGRRWRRWRTHDVSTNGDGPWTSAAASSAHTTKVNATFLIIRQRDVDGGEGAHYDDVFTKTATRKTDKNVKKQKLISNVSHFINKNKKNTWANERTHEKKRCLIIK